MFVAYGRQALCVRNPSRLTSSVNLTTSSGVGGDVVRSDLNSRDRDSPRPAQNSESA